MKDGDFYAEIYEDLHGKAIATRRSETAKHLAAETELQKSAVKALHGPAKHPSLVTNEPRVLVQPTVQQAINTPSYPHCTPPSGLVTNHGDQLEKANKKVGWCRC